MTDKYLTSKTTFSKKVNPAKYTVQTYMLVKTCNLLFVSFLGISHYTMKSILNTGKKTLSNLIKVISSYNICLELKFNEQKKQPFVTQYQKLLIFLRILLFHFIKSLSTV